MSRRRSPFRRSFRQQAGHPTDDPQKVAAFTSEWVAAFVSEWWPPSRRNGGRLRVGIPGRIRSESAPGYRTCRVYRFPPVSPGGVEASIFLQGKRSPFWGSACPKLGSASPTWGSGCPIGGNASPKWGNACPIWGDGCPILGNARPVWGDGCPTWGRGCPVWGDGTSTFEQVPRNSAKD